MCERNAERCVEMREKEKTGVCVKQCERECKRVLRRERDPVCAGEAVVCKRVSV